MSREVSKVCKMANTSSIYDDRILLNFPESSTTKMGDTSVKYSPNPDTILGTGIPAIVYPGYHFGIYVPAAVKLIKKQYLRQEDDQVNEFKIWIQSGHNNIIRLYDSYKDPNVGLFLAMEWAVRTFREQIEKCDPSREEVIRWLFQISTGLEYIHGKGGIHKEIKPDNILMVAQDGKLVAKLADFGVSKSKTYRTGVLDWRAPEELSNPTVKFVNTKMSDIFALGMTIYFGLSKGGHPFSSTENAFTSLFANMTNPNFMPKELSLDQVAGNDLLIRMLSREPKNRLNISGVLSHCLFWDWEKEQKFLVRAAICLSSKDCVEIAAETDIKYKQYFSYINPGKTFNWIRLAQNNGLEIPEYFFTTETRLKPTKEYGDGESVTKFVKFFRDKYVHYPDMKWEGKVIFTDNDQAFDEETYVKKLTSICPGLSVFLYTGLSLNLGVHSLLPVNKIYFPSKLREGVQQTSIDVTTDMEGSVNDLKASNSTNFLNKFTRAITANLSNCNIGNGNAAELKPNGRRVSTFYPEIGRRLQQARQKRTNSIQQPFEDVNFDCIIKSCCQR